MKKKSFYDTDSPKEVSTKVIDLNRSETNQSAIIVDAEAEGGLDLKGVLEAARRQFLVISIVTVTVMGGAILLNRTRAPLYAGKFSILIEPVTAESQVVSALSGTNTSVENRDIGSVRANSSTLDYPTQIELLLSPQILNPVVEKLQTTFPNISYETLRRDLLIERLRDTKILSVNFRSGAPEEVNQVLTAVSDAYIHYSISQRKTNIRRAVQFVNDQLPEVEGQLREQELELQKFRQQHQISDPSLLATQSSAQIGNTEQEKLQNQIELNQTRRLYESVSRQLQLTPKEAEAAVILSENPEYLSLVRQLHETDVAIQVASAEYTSDHPRLLALQEQRQKLLPLLQKQAQASLGTQLYSQINNPQGLPYQNSLRRDLSNQLVNTAIQLEVLETRQNSLAAARQALGRQSEMLPSLIRQYEDLQRRLQISAQHFSRLLELREELMINAARQEVPWEIVSPPTSARVSSASLKQDLVLGTALGLLLGLGIALLLEKFRDVIHSLDDLKAESNLPVLGMIPKSQTLQELSLISQGLEAASASDTAPTSATATKTKQYHYSPFVEAFRSLNSQIRLLNPDAPVRSLVISSSSFGEGKSTLSAHLAQSAAAMGQRVLLIDADLRKPSLQSIFGHDPMQGLTEVLSGQSTLEEAIQVSPHRENLFILHAGLQAIDPTGLLASQRMQELMRILQEQFDLVIYDTPPLNFADALLLIPKTDGLMLVTRLGVIQRETLKQTLRLLQTSKVPLLGLIGNCVNLNEIPGKNYHYGNRQSSIKTSISDVESLEVLS